MRKKIRSVWQKQYRLKRKAKDPVGYALKEKERHRNYYLNNKEHVLLKTRDWQLRHPERKREIQRASYHRRKKLYVEPE